MTPRTKPHKKMHLIKLQFACVTLDSVRLFIANHDSIVCVVVKLLLNHTRPLFTDSQTAQKTNAMQRSESQISKNFDENFTLSLLQAEFLTLFDDQEFHKCGTCQPRQCHSNVNIKKVVCGALGFPHVIWGFPFGLGFHKNFGRILSKYFLSLHDTQQ